MAVFHKPACVLCECILQLKDFRWLQHASADVRPADQAGWVVLLLLLPHEHNHVK
jgi:hypothetical protein